MKSIQRTAFRKVILKLNSISLMFFNVFSLLAALLTICPYAIAETWEDQDGVIWSFSNSEFYDEERQDWGSRITITSVQPIKREMTVPKYLSSTYMEYDDALGEFVEKGNNKVEAIGAGAFEGRTTIERINLPDSVKIIGDYAFRGCDDLMYVTGKNVEYIGESAFENCLRLQEVQFNDFGAEYIGNYAFNECQNLRAVTKCDDKGVYNVFSPVYVGCGAFQGCLNLNCVLDMSCAGSDPWGDYAFCGCKLLAGTISIPSDWSKVSHYIFRDCEALNGMLTFPDHLEEIGYYAFAGCKGITGNLVLPPYLKYLGAGAFENCSGLTAEVVKIPNTLTSLDTVFPGCNGLLSFEIPDSISSIGGNTTFPKQAISYKDGLGYVDGWLVDCDSNLSIEVIIPEGTRGIANYAFYQATKIISLVIPEGVKSVPYLGSCTRLSHLVLPDSIESFPSQTSIPSGIKESVEGVYYVGNWAVALSQKDTKDVVLREGTRGIAISAFGSTGIESIRIPRSVKYIGSYAFNDCGSLKSVYIYDLAAWCDIAFCYNNNPLSGFVQLYLNDELVENLIFPEDVTRVGSYAFYGNTAIKGTLSIPGSVTNIGYAAFLGCGFTGDLRIPEGVKIIEDDAFRNCNCFTGRLQLPQSLRSIGSHAFYECKGLSGDLVLPPNVAKIGSYAFYGDSGFTGTLTLPTAICEVGDSVFNGTRLSGHLIIPGGIKNIPNHAFIGSTGFTSLTLEQGVEQIGVCAFYGCTGLSGTLTIPSSVTNIGSYAFYNCSGFTGNLTIPNGLKGINDYVFNGCSGLSGGLIIGDSVEYIGNCAFQQCSGFSGDLYIPINVTYIGYGAFNGCSGLDGRLTIAGGVKEFYNFFNKTAFSSVVLLKGVERINDNALDGFKTTLKELLIPGTVKVIPNCLCRNMTCLEKLTIEYGVERIGNYAFDGCTALKGPLEVPNSVNYIGVAAFRNCSSITGALDVPEGVVEICDSAFQGCSGFSGKLIINDGVQSIANRAFSGCSGISGTLVVPGSVVSLSANAFDGCSRITEVVLGEGVKTLLTGMSGMKELTIPGSIKEIPSNMFAGNLNLTRITLGRGIERINNEAFRDCANLSGTLTIPDTVTYIGYGAFYGCTGLTGDLVIPGSVKKIACYENRYESNPIGAFQGCTGFNGRLIIEEGVGEIWDGAFAGCTGFTGDLMIPSSVRMMKCDCSYDRVGIFEGCTGFNGSLEIKCSKGAITRRAFQDCSGFIGDLTIPGSVRTVGAAAFKGCTGFNGTLTIQEGVKSLDGGCSGDCPYWSFSIYSASFCDYNTDNGAFYGCSGVRKVVLPSSIERSLQAFRDCISVSSVVFAPGTKFVGGFRGCTGLTAVDLPDGVEEIDKLAFSDCTQLVNMELPASVKKIGDGAFRNCHKLLKLTWPQGAVVGMFAFQGCSSWKGVFNVPNGVTSIASGTFYGCSNLQQINLPEGLTSIGEEAFLCCSSLREMELPEGVVAVSRQMFYGCTLLGKITLPSTIKSIDRGAFAYCRSLLELTIPYGCITLGSSVFESSAVQSVTVPSTLTNVDGNAFAYGSISRITFDGELPVGYELWSQIGDKNVAYPRASGSRAVTTWPVTQFMGYVQDVKPTVTIISSKIRENDPEVLDVVYKVTSSKPTVKVRALAFQDGERSFAKVVRPADFIADLNGNETKGNVGDSVTANEEHTLSWKVSSDWSTRLAKVMFEVLAVEDDILPLELMTIPGTAAHPETWQVSWNYVTADKSFEALLWLYADKDLGLTLQDGVLRNGDTRLAQGTGVSAYDALVYIYGKMGFKLLDGDNLAYVKEATRFDFPDRSVRQYAYRVVNAQNQTNNAE